MEARSIARGLRQENGWERVMPPLDQSDHDAPSNRVLASTVKIAFRGLRPGVGDLDPGVGTLGRDEVTESVRAWEFGRGPPGVLRGGEDVRRGA